MTIEMKELIESNYEKLFNNYCKFKDKNVITSSCNCEDQFNTKILSFLETDVPNPTIEMIKVFLKTKRKKSNIKTFKAIEYRDCYYEEIEELEIDDKIQLLFIDYRKK